MSQVGDYNIANASGASVRSDINAVLDAIKTCNSGGSDPANPEAFMLYADTADNNNLKIRRAANDGFTTIGSVNEPNLGLIPKDGSIAMTGAFKISDGNQGAPGLSFNSDPDTGFFKVSTNSIGVTTGGTKRFTVGSYGIELRNGAQFEFRKNDNTFFTAFSASDSISENRTYTLPPAVVDGGFLRTDANGNLSFATPDSVPTGCVFCRAAAIVPAGYLECNGAAVSRTTYSALFAVIGTTYGSGNGSSTFNLPDLRGEFIRGYDNGRGVDSGRGMNNPQGSANQSHNHSYGNNGITVSGANHKHNIRGFSLQPSIANVGITLGSGQGYQIGYRTNDNVLTGDAVKFSGNLTMTGTVGITINNTGGNESRPRNISMMYIIRI